MATYKVTIDEKNISGKRFLEYMKTLSYVSIAKNKNKKISGLEEALKDIEEGRVSDPMTIEEFKVYTQKIWDEA